MWAEVKKSKKNNANKIRNTITHLLATQIPLSRYGFQVLNPRTVRHIIPEEPMPIRHKSMNKEDQIPQNATSQRHAINCQSGNDRHQLLYEIRGY